MKEKGLTSSQLKWVAFFFMLIDHIGYLLLDEYIILRILGRIAFPIFAYQISEGYRHTLNLRKYLLRLLLLAIIYQVVYSYCMETKCLNIFFSLFMGLSAIIIFEALIASKKIFAKVLNTVLLLLCIALGHYLNLDYGAYGILLILFCHVFHDNLSYMGVSWLILTVATAACGNISMIQICCIAALPVIGFYNGKYGNTPKWVFYFLYCVHIPIIWLVGQFLSI